MAEQNPETKILIEDIVVDVLSGLSNDQSFTVSQRPIEDGSYIADHRTAQPVQLNLTCLFAIDRTQIQSDNGEDAQEEARTYWIEKRDQLKSLIQVDQVIKIVTPEDTFSSMMVTNLSESASSSIGSGYRFSLSLVAVNFVNSRFVIAGEASASKRLRGKKQPKHTDTERDEDPKEDQGNKPKGKSGPELFEERLEAIENYLNTH